LRTALIILFSLWTHLLFGINGSVTPLRACLNNNDSIITLTWTNPTDGCASFVKHRLYARENANPFLPIAEFSSLAVTSFQYKLPNLNNSWQFYWVTLTACNGIDSFTSNITSIDLNKPPLLELDSVSIDLATQNLIAGWQPNSATDTKGYRIYEYKSGINDSIADTSSTFYKFYNNSSLNRFVTISTYDSCNLYSPISNPHFPVLLNAVLDTCAKQIALNWGTYTGWTTSKYYLMANKNKSGYETDSILLPSNRTLLYNKFNLGDSVCFFVRAESDKGITSSSNEICFFTRAKETPTKNYLNQVTVFNNASLIINWDGEGLNDVSKIELTKSENGNAPAIITAFFNVSMFSYSDVDVNVHNTKYNYAIDLRDVCNVKLSSSNISNNIVLKLTDDQLSFNNYNGWAGKVDRYDISSGEGSTWNISSTQPTEGTVTISEDDKSLPVICYYIQASEMNNPFNKDQTSVSNTVCYEGPFTYYVPNAIVPNGVNNYFSVVGVNIDQNLSRYTIFNRWGEIIFQSKHITDKWYADYQGETVQAGIYFYLLEVFSKDGERASAKGEIRIIK
jgi:gliding motility-associated-like protein